MNNPSSPLTPPFDVRTEIDSSEPPARTSQSLRWVELLLVLLVAFGVSVSVSIYTVVSGAKLYGSSSSPALNFAGVIQEVAALGVLFYVLCLNTTPKNIEFIASGFTIWSLVLVIVNPFFEELKVGLG